MSLPSLLEALAPVLAQCQTLDLADPKGAGATLRAAFPEGSAALAALWRLGEAGVKEGWLCNRGEGGVRYSRVLKAEPGKAAASVDAVLLSGAGPRHRHPQGEVDLCFTWEGDPRFDGHEPGWVVFPADSTHTPTVTGGTMLIFYVLPGGAIEWK